MSSLYKVIRAKILSERPTKSIGATDIVAIAGISPYRSFSQAYDRVTGRRSDDDVKDGPMYWGLKLEPVVAEEYAHRNCCRVEKGPIVAHPTYSFMHASLDYLAELPKIGPVVLEIKTTRQANKDWGRPGTREIPPSYYAQVQYQLAITGLARADVALLASGSDFRCYTVSADSVFQAALVEIAMATWSAITGGLTAELAWHAVQEVVKRSAHILRRADWKLYSGLPESEDEPEYIRLEAVERMMTPAQILSSVGRLRLHEVKKLARRIASINAAINNLKAKRDELEHARSQAIAKVAEILLITKSKADEVVTYLASGQ